MATLLELLTGAVARMSLPISNATVKTAARDYFNLVSAEVFAETKWKWLIKSGSISLLTSTRTYDLPADFVTMLSNMRDEAEDREWGYRDLQDQFSIDPNESESIDPPSATVLIGLNVSTGRWQAYFAETPASTGTAEFWYYAEVPVFTSANDSTSMNLYIPRYMQTAWIHGIASMYFSDKAAGAKSKAEKDLYDKVIMRGMTVQTFQEEKVGGRLKRPASMPNGMGGLVIHASAPS
jgi:hypothetical protein